MSDFMSERTSPLSRTPLLFLCALIACGLWGSAIPFIKLSYARFRIDTGNPGSLLLFAGVRFMLAGAMVLAVYSAKERRAPLPAARDWPRIALISLFQTAMQYFCYYLALRYTSGVTASILVGTNTFFSILIAALIFRMEPLTARKLTGCAVGFAGVVVSQLGGGVQFAFSLRGEGMILLSAVAAACSAVLIRRFTPGRSPILFSGWQFFLGGAALTALGLAMGGRWGTVSPASTAMLIYLALVSAVAYTLWAALLKHNPVSRVTVFGFLTPVFGVLFSALFLQESGSLDLRALAALVLVCAGIYVVNRAPENSK